MQTVSQAWKDNQNLNITSEGFVRIRYRVGDPDTQYEGVVSVTGEHPFSTIETLANGTEKEPNKYAYLSRNLWILDGTYELLDPSPVGYVGYMSTDLCGDDGAFETPPTLTVTWDTLCTELIPGITTVWAETYGGYAVDYDVDAYNGQTQVQHIEMRGNTEMLSIAFGDIKDYDRVVITVLRWSHPNNRCRVEEIYVGAQQVYNKQDIMSYSFSQHVDLVSTSLPKTEAKFALNNVDGRWNPDNPRSAEKYMLERQEILCTCGFKIGDAVEWIDLGHVYLNEWKISQNGIKAEFGARDMIEFMDAAYRGPKAGTLYEICEAALKQARLPLQKDGQNPWEISETLRGITVTEPEEYDHTVAETLQFCAFAGRCVLYQDRDGIFHIMPWTPEPSDYSIDQNNSYKNSEYNLQKHVGSIEVNKTLLIETYRDDGQTLKIENPFIQAEDVARAASDWVRGIYENRKCVSGEFRADPRLDALDYVSLTNRYVTSNAAVTDVTYTFGGAFRGKYEGRIL